MPVIAQLIISMDDQQKVSVEGPLDTRFVALGMLAIAVDVVNKRYHDTIAGKEKRVQLADASLAPAFKLVDKN